MCLRTANIISFSAFLFYFIIPFLCMCMHIGIVFFTVLYCISCKINWVKRKGLNMAYKVSDANVEFQTGVWVLASRVFFSFPWSPTTPPDREILSGSGVCERNVLVAHLHRPNRQIRRRNGRGSRRRSSSLLIILTRQSTRETVIRANAWVIRNRGRS